MILDVLSEITVIPPVNENLPNSDSCVNKCGAHDDISMRRRRESRSMVHEHSRTHTHTHTHTHVHTYMHTHILFLGLFLCGLLFSHRH